MADEFLDLAGYYAGEGLTVGVDPTLDAINQKWLDASNAMVLDLLGLTALSAAYKIRRNIDYCQFATYIPRGKMIQSLDVITLGGSTQTIADWYAQDSMVQREGGGEFCGRMVIEYTAGWLTAPALISQAVSMLVGAMKQAKSEAAGTSTGAIKTEETSRHKVTFDTSGSSSSNGGTIPDSVLEMLAPYLDSGASVTL